MKNIEYSGKGSVSTMVGGNLMRVMPGTNNMDDKLADGFMKNIKGTKFEKLCISKMVGKKDMPVEKPNEADKLASKEATKKKVIKNVAKKVAKKSGKKKVKKVAKKVTKKKSKKK